MSQQNKNQYLIDHYRRVAKNQWKLYGGMTALIRSKKFNKLADELEHKNECDSSEGNSA
jgi:hypothetical protein